MKKTPIVAVTVVLVAFLLFQPLLSAAIQRTAKAEDLVAEPGAAVGYDGYFHLTFSFRASSSFVADLQEKDADYRVYATAGEYRAEDGVPVYEEGKHYASLSDPKRVTVDNTAWYRYEITVYGLDREDYNKPFAARLFFVYQDKNEETVVASPFSEQQNTVTLYDAVFATYNDRSQTRDETHAFRAPDGSYSPCEDLAPYEACLSSRIDLFLVRGTVEDRMATEYYQSPYRYSYFDGVLTVEIPGVDIPEGFVLHFYLNGEERAFEIYGGKIRLGIL